MAESCAQGAATTRDALGFSNPLVLDHRSGREEVLISKKKKNKKQPKDGLGLFICVSDSHLGSLLTNCSFPFFPSGTGLTQLLKLLPWRKELIEINLQLL